MVYSAECHLVWCPRYRRRVFVGRVAARVEAIVREVVAVHGGEVIGLEVMPDDVHLLVEVSPAVAVSRLLRALRGRGSRELGQEFPRAWRLPALWSRSWLVSIVGGAPVHVVKGCVENQERVA
jgi:REP-associated tyrosine transposase